MEHPTRAAAVSVFLCGFFCPLIWLCNSCIDKGPKAKDEFTRWVNSMSTVAFYIFLLVCSNVFFLIALVVTAEASMVTEGSDSRPPGYGRLGGLPTHGNTTAPA